MTSTPDLPGRGSATVAIHVPDESALPALAARLVAALPATAFVALEGDLGAGKTTFVKAVAAAIGIDAGDVVSPTFGLIHEYAPDPGKSGHRLVHADMYRLCDATDLRETGWEDATSAPGWVFVEWPARIAAALPPDRLDVTIAIDGPEARTFTFASRGPRHDPVIAALGDGIR